MWQKSGSFTQNDAQKLESMAHWILSGIDFFFYEHANEYLDIGFKFISPWNFFRFEDKTVGKKLLLPGWEERTHAWHRL